MLMIRSPLLALFFVLVLVWLLGLAKKKIAIALSSTEAKYRGVVFASQEIL